MADFENTKGQGKSSEMISALSASQPMRPVTAVASHKRKKAKKHVRAKSAQGRRWNGKIPDSEALPFDEYFDQDFEDRLEEEVISDKFSPPIESEGDPSLNSEDMLDPVQRPSTARQRTVPFEPSPRFNCYVSPGSRQKQRPKGKPKTIARRKIEKLRNRQNSQLLSLLKKEQKLETEREEMLAEAEGNAKEVLEKQFGVERAEASARIVARSEKNNKTLKNLAKKLGVELKLES